MLAIHAGGPASAFSAGILYGWQDVTDAEYRLPEFDVVTGASAGSPVAPFAFIGDEVAYRRAAQLFCDIPADLFGSPSVSSVWPTRSSLVSSDRLRELVEEEVDPTMIGRMNSGPIWLAARASMSLPVFWPPVWFDDNLLVDGGIMSYMPIEEVLGECQAGLAIASDLDLNAGRDIAAFAGYRQYGATLSSWELLKQRFTPGAEKPRYPNLSDVLFHAMCIPSFQHQKRLRDLAEYDNVKFIRPPVTADGFFTVDAKTSRRFEQLAYESAMETLQAREK